MDNSSVAEHQQRQRQQVVDEQSEKPSDLSRGVARISAKRSACSLYDVRRHNTEQNLK